MLPLKEQKKNKRDFNLQNLQETASEYSSQSWTNLSEKKRFHRAIAYGELSKMIKPWDPWWSKPSARNICLSKEGTQLVQPLPDQELLDDDIGSDELSEVPLGPEIPLPPLSRLSSP